MVRTLNGDHPGDADHFARSPLFPGEIGAEFQHADLARTHGLLLFGLSVMGCSNPLSGKRSLP